MTWGKVRIFGASCFLKWTANFIGGPSVLKEEGASIADACSPPPTDVVGGRPSPWAEPEQSRPTPFERGSAPQRPVLEPSPAGDAFVQVQFPFAGRAALPARPAAARRNPSLRCGCSAVAPPCRCAPPLTAALSGRRRRPPRFGGIAGARSEQEAPDEPDPPAASQRRK